MTMRVAYLKAKAERLGFELMVFYSTKNFRRHVRYHLRKPGTPFRTDINSFSKKSEVDKWLDEERAK